MAHAIDPRDPHEDKIEALIWLAVIGTVLLAVYNQPLY